MPCSLGKLGVPDPRGRRGSRSSVNPPPRDGAAENPPSHLRDVRHQGKAISPPDIWHPGLCLLRARSFSGLYNPDCEGFYSSSSLGTRKINNSFRLVWIYVSLKAIVKLNFRPRERKNFNDESVSSPFSSREERVHKVSFSFNRRCNSFPKSTTMSFIRTVPLHRSDPSGAIKNADAAGKCFTVPIKRGL